MKAKILIILSILISQITFGQVDSLHRQDKGKILVDGFAKLTIFEGNETAEDRFIVKIQGAKPIELKKSLYESTGKKLLSDYFGDNIEISKNILNNNLKFEDLKRIVSGYNNWRRSIDRMTNDVGK